jgi:hypothetical protein
MSLIAMHLHTVFEAPQRLPPPSLARFVGAEGTEFIIFAAAPHKTAVF